MMYQSAKSVYEDRNTCKRDIKSDTTQMCNHDIKEKRRKGE
jgi:hypothetical protein